MSFQLTDSQMQTLVKQAIELQENDRDYAEIAVGLPCNMILVNYGPEGVWLCEAPGIEVFNGKRLVLISQGPVALVEEIDLSDAEVAALKSEVPYVRLTGVEALRAERAGVVATHGEEGGQRWDSTHPLCAKVLDLSHNPCHMICLGESK